MMDFLSSLILDRRALLRRLITARVKPPAALRPLLKATPTEITQAITNAYYHSPIYPTTIQIPPALMPKINTQEELFIYITTHLKKSIDHGI